MTSENQNFTMYAGESKVITITVRDAAGALVTLTGATIEWVLKLTEDDTTALITKNNGVAGGVAILDQGTNEGEFTVTLATADTETLGGLSYYHEAEVTDASANVSTVTRGTATIKKALT